MWAWVWSAVAVCNVVALLAFGWDKWRSTRRGRRVSERTLLALLFGGVLGAWVAMKWFRHKTRKQPFRRWAIVWTIANPLWPLAWWWLRALWLSA